MKTEDNLKITIKKNKDGTLNKKDTRRYNQAAYIKKQLKEFDDWDRVFLHHSAIRSGYIPKNKGCYVRKYNGRFGVGYTVDIPSFINKNRFERRYYIFRA